MTVFGVVLTLSVERLEAAVASDAAMQEQGDVLMKNIEEMIAHGGMGDAQAIVHHCGQAAHYAETLLSGLPESDPRRTSAIAPLTQVIQQCRRVSQIGVHADPGLLLNPALKARAAARESMKLLGLAKTNKS